MRLVVVMPGHDYSTHDVYEGLVFGLRQAGHTVTEYDLGLRLDMATVARGEAWRQSRLGQDLRPGLGDFMYEAGHAVYAAVIESGADAVVVVSGDLFHPQHVVNLRKAGMTVGIVHTEGPYWDHLLARRFRDADIVWCQERTSPQNLIDQWADTPGPVPVVRYLPHGYHPEQHRPGAWPEDIGRVPSWDVVFVGTFFRERIELLEGMYKAGAFVGARVGLYGHLGLLRAPAWLGVSKARPVFPYGWRHRLLQALARVGHPSVSPLWQYTRGGVCPNTRTRAMYQTARVGLNLFRGSEMLSPHSALRRGAESMNPRCYELAACGAFFISDRRPELQEVFGRAVPTFDTAEQAAQLVRHYLANPSERASLVAEAVRAVAPHSYTTRAAQMVEDLRRVMAGRSAGAEASVPTRAFRPVETSRR